MLKKKMKEIAGRFYKKYRDYLCAKGKFKSFEERWARYYNEEHGINRVAKSFKSHAHKLIAKEDKTRIMVVGIFNSQKKVTYKGLIKRLARRNDADVLIVEDRSYFDRHRIKDHLKYMYFPNFELGYKSLRRKHVLSVKDVMSDVTLSECAVQFVDRGFVNNIEDAKVVTTLYYDYYKLLFDVYKPHGIILYNKFTPSHKICEYVARENNSKVIYVEYGVLPGTYAAETDGQMGESYPATHSDEFKNLAVTEEEMAVAREIREYLVNSGLNRNIQKNGGEVNELLSKLDRTKPLIVFAGNYDLESGMVPYNDSAKKYHTPSFSGSIEALEFLAPIAKKNNWNLVYKPHPIMIRKSTLGELPDNVIYLPYADLNELIDASDLIITLTSQTAYISCIRKITTLTLGYNQLREKGCTYEAYSRDTIEDTIEEALENGYTDEQSENFIKHIAQLSKYYLFDGKKTNDPSIHYGKKPDEFVDYILNACK